MAVSLTVQEDGPRVVIQAERPNDGRGLYKAWLRGGAGRFLLGTMIPDPEGRTLQVKRTLSIDTLRRSGVWPVMDADAELAFPFGGGDVPIGWQEVRRPTELFDDTVLAQAAGTLELVFLHRGDSGFSLAAPYREGQEFPLTPVFCFARLERLDGQLCTVFRFDQDGFPLF